MAVALFPCLLLVVATPFPFLLLVVVVCLLLGLVLLLLGLLLRLLSLVFRYVFYGCVSIAGPGASIAL